MAYLELTVRQTELHTRALRLSREHRELEAKLCECLREIDETKLFKKLGWPSLFIYATRELGFTEAIAYAFISVARKSREIPELKAAIEEKTLSVAKASRMVSGLNLENAGELIDFAKTRSTRELEAELARRNPESRRRDHVRFVNSDSVELRAYLPKSVRLKLERVMTLLAQKGKPTNLATAIESALDEYLKHHDPLEKAKRAEIRAARRREAPHQNFGENAKCIEERAELKGWTSRDDLDRESKWVKERATLRRQVSRPDTVEEATRAEERSVNESLLSRHVLVQNQRSRLGQKSKPSQVPVPNQAPRIDQSSVLGEGPMTKWEFALDQGSALSERSAIDHKLTLGQGFTLRENSVVGHEPALRQGSRHENTRSVSLNPNLSRNSSLNPSPNSNPGCGSNPNSNLNLNSNPNSSPSRSLDSNSSPICGTNLNSNSDSDASPGLNSNHDSNINNKYVLRTHRVFAETQLTQPGYSPGGDLTKVNLSATQNQSLVSDQKSALSRNRDLSEKHISSPKQPHDQKPASRRQRLSASEKHAVFLRDEGRCTFVNERGERCGADRYLHVHHIKMVSHGGTNELSNTTTLCAAHHDLAHQLSFPVEGQINWLRAPVTEYVA